MSPGQVLRAARLGHGLSQARLALRAGTTQTYVSRIERGAVAPSFDTLQRLLHAMGLRLRLEVAPLDPGTADRARLRSEFEATTPEERVDQAMTLSRFLTAVSVRARRRPVDDGPPG